MVKGTQELASEWVRGGQLRVHFTNATYVYDKSRRMLLLDMGWVSPERRQMHINSNYNFALDAYETGVIEDVGRGVTDIYSPETWEAAKKSSIERWDLTRYPSR